MNRTYKNAWEIWIERSRTKLGAFHAERPPKMGERIFIDGTPYRVVEMEEISQPGPYENVNWNLVKVSPRDAAEEPPMRFFTNRASKEAFESRQADEVTA